MLRVHFGYSHLKSPIPPWIYFLYSRYVKVCGHSALRRLSDYNEFFDSYFQAGAGRSSAWGLAGGWVCTRLWFSEPPFKSRHIMIQFAQNRGPVALHVSRSLHKALLFVIAVANHFVNKPSSIADEVCCTASTSVKTEKLRGDNPHFTRISKHRIYMREVTPGGKFDPVNFKTIPLVKKIPRKFT